MYLTLIIKIKSKHLKNLFCLEKKGEKSKRSEEEERGGEGKEGKKEPQGQQALIIDSLHHCCQRDGLALEVGFSCPRTGEGAICPEAP